MNKNTQQAITEVLAAIETLKGEVIRLQDELNAQQTSIRDFENEIVEKALADVFFYEDDLITIDINQNGLTSEITAELDGDACKVQMEDAIRTAFQEVEYRLSRESVTDED